VRVRKIVAIKNTVALVIAVAYFAMIYMGTSLKLKMMKEKIVVLAKRFFAVPVFFCYSMADGIYNLLKLYNNPINKKSKPLGEFQLFFNFD
jgi:choline-glycine betaine transporter